MLRNKPLLAIPVSYFGIVLGLSGMGLAWRYGASVALLPHAAGEIMLLISAVVWVTLMGGYAAKWMFCRNQAQQELHHVVQCCFISLIPVGTLLVGLSVFPYHAAAGWALLIAGLAGQLLFACYRAAGLWKGVHTPEATTPIVYLPTVASNLASATALAMTGHPAAAMLFFGAGMLSWLSTEAAILQRLRTLPALEKAARPVLGIQLAPPFVACSAYFAIKGGSVDIFSLGLIGYGLLQLLFLVRLLPWISQGGFSMSFWAFSFGLASMAGCGLHLVHEFVQGELHLLGWFMFLSGGLCLALLSLATLWKMASWVSALALRSGAPGPS